MTDANLTSLVFLLDRSGSMASSREATITGFAAYLEEQRTAPGRTIVSLSQFDDRYENVYTDLDLADVPPLDLAPRGSTALLDAMGRVVAETRERIDARPEDERPGQVYLGIMTDGYENASSEYTHEAIKALVNQMETEHNWVVLYMGANQDAIEVGSRIGVRRDRAITYDAHAAAPAMAVMSQKLRKSRVAYSAAAPRGAADAAAARDALEFFDDGDRAAARDAPQQTPTAPTAPPPAPSQPPATPAPTERRSMFRRGSARE